MSRRLDPEAPSVQVAVRLTPALVAALDVELERLRLQVPGTSLGRSDAIRAVLHRALLAPSAAPQPAQPPEVPAPPAQPRGAAVEVPAPTAQPSEQPEPDPEPDPDPRQLDLPRQLLPEVRSPAPEAPRERKRHTSAPSESADLTDPDQVRALLVSLHDDEEKCLGKNARGRRFSYRGLASELGLTSNAVQRWAGGSDQLTPDQVRKLSRLLSKRAGA